MHRRQSRPAVPPQYLTLADVAARWSVSVLHVRRPVWRGDLRAIKLGSVVRVAIAEIERYERELKSANS